MFGLVRKYTRWLHTQWPAGAVEKLPQVNNDGSTNVAGLYIVGDLTGIPLLKFAADTGAKAVHTILADPAFKKLQNNENGALDLVIVGGGVSGMAAALEASKAKLNFEIYEAAEPFSTVVNFPKGKPIYTYPSDMTPTGELQFTANVKESLVDELRAQTLEKGIQPKTARVEKVIQRGHLLELIISQRENVYAYRVIVAIGRSGNFRKLDVPGEDLDKVFNRLHDPQEFCGQDVLVVGGGDSALETAIAIAECGGKVTLSYRKPEFSRPKPENIEKINILAANSSTVFHKYVDVEKFQGAAGFRLRGAARVKPRGSSVEKRMKRGTRASQSGAIQLMMPSQLREIRENEVVITKADRQNETIHNNVVFSMIGREAPLDFFRRSGVKISGEWRTPTWISFALILAAFTFVYHWKKSGVWLPINAFFAERHWFPFNIPGWWESLDGVFVDPAHLLGTLRVSIGEPGFYYTATYCVCMMIFGYRRIRRRKTSYVKVQTLTLICIQIIPLFLLPYVLLPWMGNTGWFDDGVTKWIADQLFPVVDYGHGREYWRVFGFVLAWPLFFWNIFTDQPLWGWLVISVVQTFVILPLIIRRWGKGAYCGWICSCGGMAETMGDAHRHKMPHGPIWNRLNMIGQVFLAVAFILLGTRSLSWIWPNSFFGHAYEAVLHGIPALNYVWFVDLLWAGIIGFGCYWHFSGRVWCRFACPLAALMHIYTRFSRFRIFADKKKCISCNVCTSVCHQGIDVMNFANKGLPMADPECVRCSACVQSCPTGVLGFGQINLKTGQIISRDSLVVSLVVPTENPLLIVNKRLTFCPV